MLEKYDTAAKLVFKLYAESDKLFAETVDAKGVAMRKSLDEVEQSAEKDNDLRVAYLGADAQNKLMIFRLRSYASLKSPRSPCLSPRWPRPESGPRGETPLARR